MALINEAPDGAVQTNGVVGNGWRTFFSNVGAILIALTLSGKTANRPTALLWVGRPYFDTDLGIPIWLQSSAPNVWVDATGAPV